MILNDTALTRHREGSFMRSICQISYNFAPPSLRRAVGIFGFLHKRVLGICHPALCEALPFTGHALPRWRSKALESFSAEVKGHYVLYGRSLWKYILIYNLLPQGVADLKDVHTFQSKLTHMAKERAATNDPHWRDAFQSCSDPCLN